LSPQAPEVLPPLGAPAPEEPPGAPEPSPAPPEGPVVHRTEPVR
jgi:hypothetical protein